MKHKLEQYKSLREELKSKFILTKLKDDLNSTINQIQIKRKSPLNIEFYKTIGINKFQTSKDYRTINNKIANFVVKLLEEENKINFKSTHLNIRDIHKQNSFKLTLFIYPLIYGVPLLFILKFSKIKSMFFMRFIFIIPILCMHKPVNDCIKTYVTYREGINMLYCIGKFYNINDDNRIYLKDAYDKYLFFMKENKLSFKNVEEMKVDRRI